MMIRLKHVLVAIATTSSSVVALIPGLAGSSLLTSRKRVSKHLFEPDSITSLLQDAPLEDPTLLAVGIPAVAGLFAASTYVPENLLDAPKLSSVLEDTYLGRGGVEKVYKASRDGWTAIDFHSAVDERGSGLVVARGRNGVIFGGYNPNGWRSTDDYYLSSQAFLWYFMGQRVVKLPTLPGGNCAVFDYATAGPTFGAADLMIGPPQAAIMGGFAGPDAEDTSMSAGNLRQCKSSVGSSYDGDETWPVRGSTKLTEVEVYCSKTR